MNTNPGINPSGINPRGYGPLTPDQEKAVGANKKKIQTAKNEIVKLREVRVAESNAASTLMKDKIKTVSLIIKNCSDKDKSHPPLTNRQKEILSKFKKESETIKNKMESDLTFFYDQSVEVDGYINDYLKELNKAEEDITNLEKIPGVLAQLPLIRKKASKREKESNKMSDKANPALEGSLKILDELKLTQKLASTDIKSLEDNQKKLTNKFKTDLKNAGDLHQAILYTKNLRQELLDDVDKKDFRSDVKGDIQRRLDELDGKIKKLAKIEKEIGSTFTDNKSLNEKLVKIKVSIDNIEEQIGLSMDYGVMKTRNKLVEFFLGKLELTHNFKVNEREDSFKWPDRPVIVQEALNEPAAENKPVVKKEQVLEQKEYDLQHNIGDLPPPIMPDMDDPFIGNLPPPLDPNPQQLPPPNVYVQQEEPVSVDINSLPPPSNATVWEEGVGKTNDRIAQMREKEKVIESERKEIKEDVEKTKVRIDKMREKEEPSSLLAAIQKGTKLRKTVIEPKPEIKKEETSGLTQSKLIDDAKEVAEREKLRRAIEGSDDDSDDDDWK